MLRIRSLEAGYGKLKVLKNISLHVKAGEIVTIIGANGAGKSTLLNTIAGLVKPSSGEILIQGNLREPGRPDLMVKGGCALVPEGRQLYPSLTVKENLVLGGYILGGRRGRRRSLENLEEVYRLFPVLKERRSQLAGTLSGGEQQMVAIGRALMSEPEFLLMDEPSMGLAPLIIRDIFDAVKALKDRGKTVLIVEQNARAVLEIAHRGYVMETGSLIMEGTGADLLDNNEVKRAYLGRDYKEFTD